MVQQERKPRDQRLTEHWARQAREAANNPRRRPSFREHITSPYYWLAVIFLLSGVLLSRVVGAVAFVAYIPAFVVMLLDARRLRARRPPVTDR
jgi:hypothetical protein